MPERIEIDKSFILLFDEVPGSETLSIGLWADVGSRDEDKDQMGYCHFVEHMLFKGTDRRSHYDIALEIDTAGGEINGVTDKEQTYFYVNVSSETHTTGLDILSDIFFSPNFNVEDFEKERSVILDEIEMIEDNPDDFVYELFSRTMWGDNPLGNPVVGTRKTVSNAKIDRVRKFYEQYFPSGKVILSIAGGINKESILNSVERYFDLHLKSRSRNIKKKNRERPSFHPSVSVVNRDIEQIYCILGTESVPSNDERRYALYLLNLILGASFSSRFFQKIREKMGLCYSISTSNTGFSDTGEFSISFTTSRKNLSSLLEALKEEMGDIIVNGVREEELERARMKFRGNYILAKESNEWRMARMAYQELIFGRLIPYEETLKKIEEVELEDVRSLAESILRKGFVVASIGPKGHGKIFAGEGFFIN